MVPLTDLSECFGWLELERQRKVPNVFILALSRKQLTRDIELKRLSCPPIIRAPLIKQHITILVDSTPLTRSFW